MSLVTLDTDGSSQHPRRVYGYHNPGTLFARQNKQKQRCVEFGYCGARLEGNVVLGHESDPLS